MKKFHLFVYVFVILHLFTLVSLSAADEEKNWTAQQAVAYALANSPDSSIAKRKIEAAEAMVEQSESGNYPQIHLISEYSQTNNPMYSFGHILNQGEFDQNIDFNDPGRTDNLQLKAELRYRVYSGGQIGARIQLAKTNQANTKLALQTIHNRLSFEVIRFFHMIHQNRNLVNARRTSLEAIRASLETARARFEAGDLLKQDLLNIEVQEARAQANLIQANHDLDLTKRAFSNLLGLNDSTVAIDSADTCQQQIPEMITPDNRSEIRQVDMLINMAEIALKKAKSEQMPVVDTFANYQINTGSVLDGTGDSWMAGIKLDYALFDGHRVRGTIRAAEAHLLEAKERKQKLLLDIRLEIEQARLALQQTEEKLRVTEKMVGLALESARLSRVRFKQGVLLASELIDAETRLTDALVHRSVARATNKIAIAGLRRAVGLPQFQ